MKVFVVGGTGVIGRCAVPALLRAGHDVSAVARSPARAGALEREGATAVRIDPWDGDALATAVAGQEVVVNLTTAIPTPSRALLPGAWHENDRIRRELSRCLVDAALAAGSRRYVQESLAFTYPDGADRWLDEDEPIDAIDQTASVRDAEAHTARFTREGGTGVVLRFGFLIDPGTSGAMIVDGARRGRVPLFGEPEAYAPFLHPMDAGSAVASALEAPSGTYNVVESQPRPRGEHACTLGGLVGRKVDLMPRPLGRVPRLRVLARSQRVASARLREVTSWRPRWASDAEGWREIAGRPPEASMASAP